MLTDDELTHELGAAFRAGTSDLTYAGRRRPRRVAAATLPAAAVVVALAAVAVGVAASGTNPAPAAGPGTPSAVVPTRSAALVTDTIDLAGYTLT